MSTSKRTVPMQVLSLSPPRTGTLSMQKALERLLDAPVYHGYIAAQNEPKGKYFLNHVVAKYEGTGKVYGRVEFDGGLGGYAATTDTPTCFLWRELMAAYPEAKVVLVHRDIESWYQSFADVVIWKGLWMPFTNLVPYLEPFLNFYCLSMNRKLVLGYFGVTTPEELLENARDVYRRHYVDIREACRSSGTPLLEMTIDEGWEPLANFLGRELPEEPFPHTNEKEAQQAISRGHRTRAIVNGLALALLYIVPPLATLALAVYWMK